MDSLLSWYQVKIGAYDLQIWERAVEVREQQDGGMKSMYKRTSSVKPELIDIDLVRGSTFSKNKPQYSWLVVTCQAFIRVLFLPLFIRWWIQQTSKCIMLIFFCLYFLHALVVFMYLTGTDEDFKFVSPSEVTMPPILMLLLGSVHCHVVSTNFRLNVKKDSRRIKQKRTLSSALLEPVVCSSHQSALSLVASSFQAEKVAINSCPNSDCSASDEKDASASTELGQDAHVVIGRQRKQTAGKLEQSTLHAKSTQSQYPEVDDLPNGSGTRCGKSSVTSGLNKENSDHSEAGSIGKDTISSSSLKKKRKRHTVHLEELHSTSSSSNSSAVSGETTDSETSSTNDAETIYQNNIDKIGKSKLSATALLPCASQGVDRISVKIWECNQCKKVQASLLDIGGIIRRKVHQSLVQSEMLFIGLCFSIIISCIPNLYRIAFHQNITLNNANDSTAPVLDNILKNLIGLLEILFLVPHGDHVNFSALFVIYAVVLERFIFAFTFFVMLCAAHKTFRQRFLFAKYFSHLTSSRRAKKSEVPHFRLDKVENVRLWLSLRSYLRRRGPLRSVDVIVSSAFFISLFLLCFISLQLLHDTDLYLSSLIFWEMTVWLLALAIFLLNFMTIGAQINRKYSNTSVLLTEQINLYLQLKHNKPDKKEELHRANSVLSIASKLIKEIETPFNIYGLAMNPLLYNITRVVVLSAFSGVVSEILGFKLKIWKIKG